MKWLKIAAIAIAPLILIWGVWSFMKNNNSVLPNSSKWVDVSTGEIITLSRNKVFSIPAKNDRDGKRTLFPLEKTETGEMTIPDRYRQYLKDIPEIDSKIDPNTFQVK